MKKAYKATYDMKCRGQEYKVGKVYTCNDKAICSKGIHFCYKMCDVLDYYEYSNDFVLMEIEILGDVEEEGNKGVTNKIRVLRIVPAEEYSERIQQVMPIEEKNELGQVVKLSSRNGVNYNTMEYDEKGRVKSDRFYGAGDKLFCEYLYTYDENDNIVRAEDTQSNFFINVKYEDGKNVEEEYVDYIVKYEYHENGAKAKEVFFDKSSPDTPDWINTYDKNGVQTSKQDKSGSRVDYDVVEMVESDD